MINRSTIFLATMLVGFFTSHVTAENQLARFVPETVPVCLEIDQAAELPSLLEKSGLKRRIDEFPIYKNWRNSLNYQNVTRFRKYIERISGEPMPDLLGQLFHGSVLIALEPPVNERAGRRINDNEPGLLLLIETKDRDFLERLVSIWKTEDPGKISDERILGQAVLIRGISNDDSLFVSRREALLIISNRREMLEASLNLMQQQNPRNSLASSDSYRLAKSTVEGDSAAVLYVDSTRFPLELDWNDLEAKPIRFLAEFWNRSTVCSVALRLNEGIVLDASFPSETPASRERFARVPWSEFPLPPHHQQNRLLMIAGQRGLGGLAEWLKESLPPDDRELNQLMRALHGLGLGRELLDDIIPALGPNWMVSLRSKPINNPDLPPFDARLMLDLPTNSPGIHDAINNLLATGLNVLSVVKNTETDMEPSVIEVHADREGNRERSMTRFFDWSPGFRITDDRLVVDSEWRSVSSEEELSTLLLTPRVKPYLMDSDLIILGDIQAFREFMEGHLLRLQSRSEQPLPANAREKLVKLQSFLEVLRLGDQLLFLIDQNGSHTRLRLGVVLEID